MTRVLIDTSAYSAFMRNHLGIKEAMQRADEIHLTPIVLGELLAGFRKGQWRTKNERELDTFLASSQVAVTGIDEQTSERYVVILDALRRKGRPIPTNDLWIAASAMQHGLRIVTRDPHFKYVEQTVVDYFD